MVGGGNRKDEQLVISNNNVFAALGTLRKKKKSDKGKSAGSSSSKNMKQPDPVFLAPAPLTVKSWADVDDEDDDYYYATTAPPQVVWGADTANEQHHKLKEAAIPVECIAKRIKIYERFNVPQVAVEEMTFILKTLDVGVGGKERLNLISRAYPRRIVCPISFMISVFVILILLFPDPGLWYYTGYVVVVCLLDSLSLASFLESESEEDGLDEADDGNGGEHEQEPDLSGEKEPTVKKPAEHVAPKESERQLSKKELKKKELAELEAMLVEFGLNKAESNDDSQGAAQDKVDKLNGEMAKKDDNVPGESKSAKKKKKEKSAKEFKEQHDASNGVELGNGTNGTVTTEKGQDAPTVAAKDKVKKMASLKKKKSSKEVDAAAKGAASEAAARSARLAAAKKKEKNHYNQQPLR
ncbi:putative protein OBERON 3-like [Capsicum annuum]|nr:putative protein OBERON 3-like [Capsicum annuum]